MTLPKADELNSAVVSVGATALTLSLVDAGLGLGATIGPAGAAAMAGV